jgi:hypothetical protein
MNSDAVPQLSDMSAAVGGAECEWKRSGIARAGAGDFSTKKSGLASHWS